MKRSRQVQLVLMASAAGTASSCGGDGDVPPAPSFPTVQACLDTQVFTQTACDSLTTAEQGAAEARNYTGVSDCIGDGYFTETYCEAKFAEVQAMHADHAPAYTDVRSCEEIHGPQACQPQQAGGGGGSFWTPFLTGYLVSNAISSFQRPVPYYSGRDGGYYSLGGSRLGDVRGRNSVRLGRETYSSTSRAATGTSNAQKARSGQLRASSQRTSVARRGGFGGRSGGRGG